MNAFTTQSAAEADYIGTLRAQNADLQTRLETERRANIGLAENLMAMTASRVISDRLTKANRKEITDGQSALALARGEAETSQTALVVSALALALSRAETEIGQTDLVASAEALALSRAETSKGEVGLVASGVLNKALELANTLLVTNEAVLEKLVEERTAALMREIEERHRVEERLTQGEKLQAIGRITGGIAHDLNNILQVVVGGVELLRRPRASDDRHIIWLEKIDKAVEGAKALTNRLLTFARKRALQPKVFNLNERLAGMSELLRPVLGPNIRLDSDFASDLWPVMADPDQLEVAILNLAVNARDAMLSKGGVLTLRTYNVVLTATSERLAGEYMCVAVQDTGDGMSSAVMAHVFEPFFTTKEVGKGTGLGLAQVYGFAKQSGGDVTIASVPGQGTTILLHLLRPDARAVALAAKHEDRQDMNLAYSGSGKVVLIVDDNIDVTDLTVSMLEENGYGTRTAATAAEALSIIEAGEAVDCVFADIVMPGHMNGLELANALRLRYPQLPVVLTTGYSQSLNNSSEQVSVEIVGKPYRGHELTSALERAFTKASLAKT